jgi:Amt family ammonium transporter
MVEAAASKRHHWPAILIKNLLDTISGAIAFWIIGFGIAFGKSDSRGFIGVDGSWAVSANWSTAINDDVYLKFIFQFAFCNTASAIVGGLLTERVRVETYGVVSFFISLFIYPVACCWVWNSTGWLALRGFHDFAGCSVIHLLGGMTGLVGSIIVGPRIGRFSGP